MSDLDLQNTEHLMNELHNLQEKFVNEQQTGGKRKRSSKKGSKKTSKKTSKKGSKKSSKTMKGGKRASKKTSKKASKKSSKKRSKTQKGGEQDEQDGGKRKRASKKTSKKASKKASKKRSKTQKGGEQDEQDGGKRRKRASKKTSKKASKKASKKSSKKSSKKRSKKDEQDGGAKTLNPALKATQVINERILKDVGGVRSHWFGLITYVNTLRKDAKTKVKDEKDFKAVNDKIVELFKVDLEKKGKSKIAKMIEDFYMEAMAKRGKRGSKKNSKKM
jgi:hypothetical protein